MVRILAVTSDAVRRSADPVRPVADFLRAPLLSWSSMRRAGLILFALALCGCTEPGRLAQTGCTYASDCAEGESCIEGVCLPARLETAGGCTGDLDCPAPIPHCDVTEGVCRACLTDEHCTSGWSCQGGTCTAPEEAPGCTADDECAPPSTVCVDAACAPGCKETGCSGTGECNSATGRCEAPEGCLSDADCPAATPVCDPISGACRGCTASSDCGAPTPVCHVPSGLCFECVTEMDCSAPTPVCNASTGTCEGCTPGLCSPDETCNTTTGACEPTLVPLGEACSADADCASSVCFDFGDGGRCIRACTSGADCDGGTSCYMIDGARVCLLASTAPARAEEIDCTTDADCGGSTCVWLEASSGRWDQRCMDPVGPGAPQSECFDDEDCYNGVCTFGINDSSNFCRHTCAIDGDCPADFACVYVDYPGQSYVQSVKVCLPVDAPSPATCGVNAHCEPGELCKVLDAGSQGSMRYLANVCLP